MCACLFVCVHICLYLCACVNTCVHMCVCAFQRLCLVLIQIYLLIFHFLWFLPCIFNIFFLVYRYSFSIFHVKILVFEVLGGLLLLFFLQTPAVLPVFCNHRPRSLSVDLSGNWGSYMCWWPATENYCLQGWFQVEFLARGLWNLCCPVW